MFTDPQEPDDDGAKLAETTSSQLLLRLKIQDAESWRRLTEIYGPLVYFWCGRYGLKAQDMADVFQEVFSAVWSGIEGFHHEPRRGRFRGWLWTITRSKISDHFRRRMQRLDASGGNQEELARRAVPDLSPTEPSDPEHQRQVKGVYRRAVAAVRAGFEERTWEAFWRTAVEHQSSGDVAQAMGMSPAAVRQAKARVLQRLRAELGDVPPRAI